MRILFARKCQYLAAFALLFTGLLLGLQAQSQSSRTVETPKVMLLEVDDAIGPATAEFLLNGIEAAKKAEMQAILIKLDTPGGLDSAMRDIIKGILASPIPVITYVAPSGARAASAGTYILYASSIAAMAPGTNIGAATPVSIGGVPNPAENQSPSKKPKADSANSSDMTKKIKQDATAYIRSLAELHGRNIDWAQKAVTKADSITATKAMQLGVIDIVASSIPQLLNDINGQKVQANGETITLNTKNVEITTFQPTWRIKFLSAVTNPSVAYILLLIGIYGLFFEFMNPGSVAPGVIGAISLVVALYALQMLPISYAGLSLIFLGMGFMIAEAFVPSFGVLGLGGIVAFIFGSIMLFRTGVPGLDLPWMIIAIMSIVNGLIVFAIITFAFRARSQPQVSGRERILGSVGIVSSDTEWVIFEGENWQYNSSQTVQPGQRVKIIDVNKLVLDVQVMDETETRSK